MDLKKALQDVVYLYDSKVHYVKINKSLNMSSPVVIDEKRCVVAVDLNRASHMELLELCYELVRYKEKEISNKHNLDTMTYINHALHCQNKIKRESEIKESVKYRKVNDDITI